MAAVLLGDRDDEAQVGVDHPLLGGLVATLDALRERDLLRGGEQLVLAHVLEEELEGVGEDGGGVGAPRGLLGRGGRLGFLDAVRLGHGDGAVGQRGAHVLEGGLAEVELERKRLQLGNLHAAALLGVGQEGVDGRDVDRGGQLVSFRSDLRCRGRARNSGVGGRLLVRRCVDTVRFEAVSGRVNAFPRERCSYSVQRLDVKGNSRFVGLFLLFTKSRRSRAARSDCRYSSAAPLAGQLRGRRDGPR